MSDVRQCLFNSQGFQHLRLRLPLKMLQETERRALSRVRRYREKSTVNS
jgi:hypothetical protein